MDYAKISDFIKRLRKEKKWSQEKLADMLYMDRTNIVRWESGKRHPDLDMIMKISEVFDVSINEMIAGERINDNNQATVQNSFYEYTKSVIKSMNKWKKFGICLATFLLLFIICFLIIYFVNNYRSVKIYSISGHSENYDIKNGILITTKQNIYFTIGVVNPKPNNITIYTVYNGENRILYEGTPDNIVIDFYGYNSFIEYSKLNNLINNFYIKIENDIIKLDFIEVYENTGIINRENLSIGKDYEKLDMKRFLEKINEKFVCNEYTCISNTEDTTLTYDLLTKTYTVVNQNEIYTYIVDTDFFQYEYISETPLKFYIENQKLNCEIGNCENSKEIYKRFKNNYVDEYLY